MVNAMIQNDYQFMAMKVITNMSQK